MKGPHSTVVQALRGSWRLIAAATLLLLAACNGTAVVTLTSTLSQDNFLAYRVALTSVQLQTSSGKSGLTVLPTSVNVDFATLGNLSEVLGAAAVAKGNYTSAVITVDYSAAQIIYDDGSVNGLSLTPVGANGQALGQVQLTVDLDPAQQFSVASSRSSRLALDFKMAASNVVNAAQKTVTVTPLIAASAMPLDAKQVRVRGPLSSVDDTNRMQFTMGVVPFNAILGGAGTLVVTPSDVATYEISGSETTGASGLASIAGMTTSTLAIAYGTLTTADDTLTASDGTTSSSTDVSFSATQVLAGSSVQGLGFDRVTGIVAARSGDTLAVEDATVVANDGTETFFPGTTTILLSANTLVTVLGQITPEINSIQEISIGSAIDAFGTVTLVNGDDVSMDASAGRVRISSSTASGTVNDVTAGALTLKLATLGGRAAGIFDFAGTLSSSGGTATVSAYSVNTSSLDLSNATSGAPVIVTGYPNSFGISGLDFSAVTLLDPTTLQAELVIDWGAGTSAPFTSYDSSSIDLDIHNSTIGLQHQIQLGAQLIDLVSLSQDPLITPNTTGSNMVFAIGHATAGSVENFNTYAAFITQLQAELSGTVLATNVTAIGQYTATSFSFAATSITISLNN